MGESAFTLRIDKERSVTASIPIIGDKDMLEAAEEMLRYGFKELGLHRIYATCRPNNIGSARVMKKIGLTYEGHLREHMYYKGKWHDSFQ